MESEVDHLMETTDNVDENKNNDVDFVEDLENVGDKDEVKVKSKKRDRKEVNSRSPYWEHFEIFFCESDKVQKARCKYCRREVKADPKIHGTRSIQNQFASYKKKPQEVATNQARITLQPSKAGEKEAQIGTWKFDHNKLREALTYWLIVDELPFKTVENKGFRHFMSIACPMFTIPSRRTTTKDAYNMYMNEKVQLMSFMQQHCQRICITTDTWTSIQRVNYMCLTAHFIDDEWTLQKRILNFCLISGNKGEDVGKAVEKCLLDWKLDKIFTITVDNASSNDVAITYLQKKFDNWKTNVLGGKYLHMRCIAHIVKLIVQDGLKGKDKHVAISRIRGAVRYVRNSPARHKRFCEFVEIEKIDTKKLLSLDVLTRWNSTYLMLESAVSLKRAFDSYADTDLSYVNDLSKPPYDGIPLEFDWERASLLLKFLGHFYKLTLAISGSLYVTSNTVFHEISSVDMLLKHWLISDDFELSEMSRKMKDKFDKYWGSIEKMNMIFYYAVILDPRHKLEFIEFSFDIMYNEIMKCAMMKEKVKNGMQEMFYDYKLRYGIPGSPTASALGSTSFSKDSQSDNFMTSRTYLKDEFRKYKLGGKKEHVKSELEKYLGEDPEDCDESFDILQWWKVNSPRFPILSRMARDVLAVPVSTVASESTFSTGGRVLDAFRSSLSPRIVQSLVCAQDWLRMDSKPICVEEDLTEIETLEKGICFSFYFDVFKHTDHVLLFNQ
ncbi:zinc finger BED domain-containing protein RICESLEEPER 2-like [Henckelia pumila]|uniref:zinc finger BED domain-containing protein RICESLEEPER 2-like n=1 Tax=Henckelia pumila TaxID=405737 RepID=UPI003C6E2DC2